MATPQAPVRVRVMFDSADVAAIPLDPTPEMVAWYPYGFPGDIKRFPKETVIVSIDNDGAHPDCDVLDVETGGATIADIPGWIEEHEKIHDGWKGAIYCDQSNLPSVGRVLLKIGKKGTHVWIADWTGQPHVFTGDTFGCVLVATQYQSPQSNPASPGQYDLSIVSDPTWHREFDAAPVAQDVAPVAAAETPDVEAGATTTGGIVTFVSNGALAQRAVSSEDLKNWTAT
jgi:hypothetical protein